MTAMTTTALIMMMIMMIPMMTTSTVQCVPTREQPPFLFPSFLSISLSFYALLFFSFSHSLFFCSNVVRNINKIIAAVFLL